VIDEGLAADAELAFMGLGTEQVGEIDLGDLFLVEIGFEK
jgi:hypothetical protein